MKKIFKILVAVIAIVLLFVGCKKAPKGEMTDEGYKTLAGKDLEDLNNNKEKDDILIIDVRPEEEYLAGNIPNSINILSDEIADNLDRIAAWKDKKVILYCNTGNRSGKAAKVLVENGFKDVYNADGVKEYDYKLVNYRDILATDLLKMKNEKDVILVDYRPKDLYDKGHIDGAINIELDKLKDNLDKLPKDKKILLYCNTGTKSADAAKELSELGYKEVYNSIEGVKEYNFDLVK